LHTAGHPPLGEASTTTPGRDYGHGSPGRELTLGEEETKWSQGDPGPIPRSRGLKPLS
jgi:hypothetical protein